MGRISNFDIAIDGTKKSYFHPGEEMKGHISFFVHGPIKISKIYVHIKGVAYCGWAEKQGHMMQNYIKKKDLIQHEIVLCGGTSKADNINSISIKPGSNSYAFRFVLPRELPTNFKSRIGFIKYCVKANIDRPWRPTLKRKLPFTVVEPIELEKSKKLLYGADGQYKEIDKCHTHDNSLSLEATLDKVLYHPGERITVRAVCDNKTSRSLRIVKAKLIKVKEYYATKTYSESRTVAKVHGPSIPKRRLFTWETQDLIVPRIPASVLSCKVLRLSYVVEVHLVVPLGYNLRVRIPVVIGNVPLKGHHALPILHGSHLRRNRVLLAMDRILRHKKTHRYNRLSGAVDSITNLELAHEEMEEDENLDDSFQEYGSDFSDSLQQKPPPNTQYDIDTCFPCSDMKSYGAATTESNNGNLVPCA